MPRYKSYGSSSYASIFPPRTSLPAGCLYHLRVWLRARGIDHQIFSDNDLWVGRDPDFWAVGDASFAVLRNAMQDMLIYQSIVGRAHARFIIKLVPRIISPLPHLNQLNVTIDGNLWKSVCTVSR
jgi:hypothetical protein